MSKEEKEIQNNEASVKSAKPKKEKKPFNKRKLKYGSLATAVTVIFIAAVVLLNILATQLTDRFGLKIDTTKEQIFEISEQTTDYLKTLNEDIEIAVMCSEETLDNGSIYYKLVKEVTEKYAQNSDKITVSFYDTEKNPEIVTKFSAYTSETVGMGKIVVFCNGRIKVLNMSDLYETTMDYQTYQQSITAITAEQVLTSAVMFVADPNPPTIAVISCQQSDPAAISFGQFKTILEDNGYTVETVDPLTQDISSDYSMVILPAPYSDLTETVITKLDDYLYNNGDLGKNLLYFASFDQRETPNLDAFLEDWGISQGNGYVSNTNAAEMLKVGIAGLQNYYAVPQAKLSSANQDLVKSTSLPVAMPMSRPLSLLFETNDDRETEVILTTSETSVIVDENTTNENIGSLPQSEQNVMVRGGKHKYEGAEQISSNIIACGSVFAVDYYITSTNALNNQELVVNLINKYTGKNEGITILSKSLELESIQMSQQTASGIEVTVQIVLPLIIAAIGTCVFIRRKNR